MKRSLRMIGLAAALSTFPALVTAQDARPVSLGISGGLSMPMGDLGNGLSSGYNVTGHIGFRPAAFTNLSFRGDVSFDRWSFKNSVDGSYRAIGGTANLVYAFPQANPGMVRPYVLGGAGMFSTKSNVETTGGGSLETGSSTDPAIQAGAGVNFALSGFNTFIEARYVNVFGDGASANWIPIVFGIRF